MGTNYFAWHGFTEVLLGDRWLKASPTFNSTLCDRFGVPALDFDGDSDALLQAYDGEGRTFMRYEVMHGAFHDVPAKFLIAEMARRYPSLKGRRGRSAGGMENEVPLATRLIRAVRSCIVASSGRTRSRGGVGGSFRRGDFQGGPHRQDRNRSDREAR